MRVTNLNMLLLFLLLLTGCSVDRYIPQEKTLYSEATIQFIDLQAPIRKQNQVETDIQNALYVKPNQKTLGLWLTRLWIYYRFKDNHEKGLPKYLYKNFHENPVYLEDLDTVLLKNIVNKQMQDHGYFSSDSKVSHEIKQDRAIVNYQIRPGRVTLIDSIQRPAPTNAVDSIAHNYRGYWLELDEPYLLNDFQEERTRLSNYIRSKGYYEFDESDIYYLVDTSDLQNSVSVFMRTKKPENDSIHRKFFIKDVNIYVKDYRTLQDSASLKNNSYEYLNYTIYDPTNYINEKAIEQNILIEEGKVFNLQDYELTLGRMINLNVFKYVNLEYTKVGKDSLDVNIYLTPKAYSGIQLDVSANTSNRSFLGSTVSANFYNDNSLGRAERLTAGLTLGSELQYIDSRIALSILNINAKTTYEIPRIISPFSTPKFRTKVPPKTVINFEEDFQLWLQFFTKNTVNVSFGYKWERKPRQSFTFDPLFVNVNNVFSTTAVFDSLVDNRPLLALSYQDNLIFGSLFAYQYSTRQTRAFGNYFNYRTSVETAGNTANLLSDIFTDASTPSLLGVAIAQYAKFDLDVRFTRGFNETSSLVARLSTGIVKPYGSSSVTPFTKQYFVGGSNSLRGFAYRSVGPGSYQGNLARGLVNPIDQAGDIKLLYNVEYRFPIFQFIRGATFIDAGNVWLLKADPTRPRANFQWNNFYKQIALNTGFGIRIDVDYFALRLDLGIPLRKPSREENNRWLWSAAPVPISSFFEDFFILSGGIGYPF